MPRNKSSHFQANSDFDQSCFLTSKFFLFFSSPTTLMILESLRKRESTSQDISKKLGIGHKAVLSRLNEMEQERILVSYAIRKNVFYRVADIPILKAFDQILAIPEKRLKRAGELAKETGTNRQKDNRPSKAHSMTSVRSERR
jgi:hypothetical protein